MMNPFVYGEVVPAASFVNREVELDRLTSDLLAGQKVFLISPRRYGKSSLVAQALRAAGRGGALTVDVTVSSYSSYVAFLEGYARALLSIETGLDKARAWLSGMLGAVRPEIRLEPDGAGSSPSPFRRHAPRKMSPGSRRRSSRSPAASQTPASASWRLPSMSSRRSGRSMAATSNTRFARPFSTRGA
jgi:hypothetical protein